MVLAVLAIAFAVLAGALCFITWMYAKMLSFARFRFFPVSMLFMLSAGALVVLGSKQEYQALLVTSLVLIPLSLIALYKMATRNDLKGEDSSTN